MTASTPASDVYVYDTPRTPRGRGKPTGSLHTTRPISLVVGLLDALAERNPGLVVDDVDDVVLGIVSPVGEQGGDVARAAVVAAGWPDAVAGVQLNRFCASGLEAVNTGAARIRAGWADLIVAGGVESMSRVPMGADGGPFVVDPATSYDAHFVPQGVGADLVATIQGFSRGDVDAFAVESQARAAKAQANGWFDRSLVPVVDGSGLTVLDHDEHVRPQTTLEDLARLRPSFEDLARDVGFADVALQRYPDVEVINHVHHAGNSSGIVDGAGLVLLGNAEAGRRHDLSPRARIVSVAQVGTEPTIMLTGPVPASEAALARAGMTSADVDLLEINEAFAAVALQTMQDLDIDHDRTNVNGGAIALGHPLGATGAIILGTLVDELERRDLGVGLATLCVGGGMGIATVVERV